MTKNRKFLVQMCQSPPHYISYRAHIKVIENMYSYLQMKPPFEPFMMQNSTFQKRVSLLKSSAMSISNCIFNTMCESFEMRCCMKSYLKGLQNCHNLKIKTYLMITHFWAVLTKTSSKSDVP